MLKQIYKLVIMEGNTNHNIVIYEVSNKPYMTILIANMWNAHINNKISSRVLNKLETMIGFTVL